MSKSILAGLFVLILAACGGNSTENENGLLALRLTDAPIGMDSVLSVNLFLVRVDARLSAADSSAAANGAEDRDSVGVNGWVTVATPNISINLLAYPSDAFFTLGSRQLPAGTYNGFRLIIDPSRSNVGLKNFTVLTGISVPNVSFSSAARSGINIVLAGGVVVRDKETTTLLIDFDAASSFVPRGNSITRDGLWFTPVVRAALNTRVP